MKKLPWKASEYRKLDPHDLDPTPAPTPEQRLRVAAAIATMIRDLHMLEIDDPHMPNAETIRAILTMSPEAWAQGILAVRGIDSFDAEDPEVRLTQTMRALGN